MLWTIIKNVFIFINMIFDINYDFRVDLINGQNDVDKRVIINYYGKRNFQMVYTLILLTQ